MRHADLYREDIRDIRERLTISARGSVLVQFEVSELAGTLSVMFECLPCSSTEPTYLCPVGSNTESRFVCPSCEYELLSPEAIELIDSSQRALEACRLALGGKKSVDVVTDGLVLRGRHKWWHYLIPRAWISRR